VRKAIGLALDFEWMNKQLFYGLYKRVNGYFPNSEFHAEGLPKPDELALLEPLRHKLRPEVFGRAPVSSSTDPPGSLRENLRQAQALFTEAGWTYRDGALRNASGEAFTMEFLNDQPSLIRIVGPFQKALEKLGIELIYRVVDFSLSKQKMDAFDFEVTTLAAWQHGSRASCRAVRLSSHTPGSSNVRASPIRRWTHLQKVVTARTRPDLSPQCARWTGSFRMALLGAAVLWRRILIGYRPRRFVLPAKIRLTRPTRAMSPGGHRPRTVDHDDTSSSACCW
jgi:microcin C transport system substrate-binding protein